MASTLQTYHGSPDAELPPWVVLCAFGDGAGVVASRVAISVLGSSSALRNIGGIGGGGPGRRGATVVAFAS